MTGAIRRDDFQAQYCGGGDQAGSPAKRRNRPSSRHKAGYGALEVMGRRSGDEARVGFVTQDLPFSRRMI
jgi:hypothetical protein